MTVFYECNKFKGGNGWLWHPSVLCWSSCQGGDINFVTLYWVDLATGHSRNDVRLVVQDWGIPSACGAIWGPSSGGFIQSVGFMWALLVPFPCWPTKWCYVVFARHLALIFILFVPKFCLCWYSYTPSSLKYSNNLVWTCDPVKTISNWSAISLMKRHATSLSPKPLPAIWLHDAGQWIANVHSCYSMI